MYGDPSWSLPPYLRKHGTAGKAPTQNNEVGVPKGRREALGLPT